MSTTGDLPARGRRRDRAATRAALLAAARRRFAAHGMDGVSVRDVAAEAGVDPALIFRYFGSKQALFTEAATVERDPVDVPAADLPLQLLRGVLDGAGRSGADHPLLALLRSSGHEQARLQLQRQMCEGFLDGFAELADGPDARLRAEMLGALLLGISVTRSVVRTPELAAADPARVEEVFAAMARAALGGPPA
ncbi:TetR/AcrR family transcriptional regulator [Pseudonocardia humida]|uniref:TetR family transcriptional regulator n=1 Tax=Pseudonocardia humida TaxID=2800819 RepID=A0ABT1A5Z6_9PSEU|nr:TetR/AcrR family transcriptional regulator [Pseudonocardia humida]MCO1658338.1 TetR family transcriptional regulator [Pseudonocardia humida]